MCTEKGVEHGAHACSITTVCVRQWRRRAVGDVFPVRAAAAYTVLYTLLYIRGSPLFFTIQALKIYTDPAPLPPGPTLPIPGPVPVTPMPTPTLRSYPLRIRPRPTTIRRLLRAATVGTPSHPRLLPLNRPRDATARQVCRTHST